MVSSHTLHTVARRKRNRSLNRPCGAFYFFKRFMKNASYQPPSFIAPTLHLNLRLLSDLHPKSRSKTETKKRAHTPAIKRMESTRLVIAPDGHRYKCVTSQL